MRPSCCESATWNRTKCQNGSIQTSTANNRLRLICSPSPTFLLPGAEWFMQLLQLSDANPIWKQTNDHVGLHDVNKTPQRLQLAEPTQNCLWIVLGLSPKSQNVTFTHAKKGQFDENGDFYKKKQDTKKPYTGHWDVTESLRSFLSFCPKYVDRGGSSQKIGCQTPASFGGLMPGWIATR